MKRATILHATSSHPSYNWQPWIKAELEINGYEVWASSKLPDSAREFREKLGGTFVAVAGAGHFSSPTTKTPEIITTLKQYNYL
jgi:hypothetical protein